MHRTLLSCMLIALVAAPSRGDAASPEYERWNWIQGKGKAHVIGGVAVVEDSGDLRIVVRGNASFRRVGLMRLKDPQRLVIDLPGVRKPRAFRPVLKAPTMASAVRTSRNGSVLRLVVDLSDDRWSGPVSRGLGNGFEVRMTRPKSVAKAKPKRLEAPLTMTDARLANHGGFVRATITFDGPARFTRDPNEGTLRSLRISNCTMPNHLVQGQDLGQAEVPLQSLSTFRDRRVTDRCRVLIDVADGAEDAVWTQGKQLVWDIRHAPKVARVAAEEDDDVVVEDAPKDPEDDPASDTGEEDEEDEDGEEAGDEEADDEEADDEEADDEEADDEEADDEEADDEEADDEEADDEEADDEDADDEEDGEEGDDEEGDEEDGEFEDEEFDDEEGDEEDGEFEDEEFDDEFTLTADRRITLDTQNADILNVLRLISEVAGINIIASDEVKGRISLRLRNVPWQDALKVVLRVKGLGAVRDAIDTENTAETIATNREEMLANQAREKRPVNIIRIDTLENLRAEAKAKAELKKTIDEGVPTKVQMFAINYATANDLAPHVEKLIGERGRVQVDERTNYLIVEATPDNLVQVQSVIQELDVKTDQVLVESRMVEANTNFVRALGIQWQPTFSMSPATGNATGLPFPNAVNGNGGAVDSSGSVAPFATSTPFAVNLPSSLETGAVGLVLGSASNALTLNLRISAGETNGTAKTISSPRVVTMNHKKAEITQGLEMTVTETTAQGPTSRKIQADLRLEVTPHVNSDGMIHMVLEIENNRPDFTRQVRGVPSIETKEARTEVMVRDGETAVLGGIYTRNMAKERKEIPGLSKVPLLGYLFRNNFQSDERRELLIFITPRLVDKMRRQAGVVDAPGEQ